MDKLEFQELLAEQHRILQKLTTTKGEEYANSDDQLANFKRQSVDTGVKVEAIWLVFFNKHMDAIKHFIRTGAVLSEPIDGRIDDAILYLCLLKAMVHEQAAVQSRPRPKSTGHHTDPDK